MSTAAELVAKVSAEGGFDTSSSNSSAETLLGWVNEVYLEAAGEAKWVRVPRVLSPTVAGGTQYAIPGDVVDIRAVKVGDSRPYARMSTEELWEAQSGVRALAPGTAGAFAPNFEDDSDDLVEVWPPSAGVQIMALCAVLPAPLTISPASTPRFPVDCHAGLADGAIAIGLERIYERPTQAAPFRARYEAMTQKLTRRANSRVGSGPVRAKIWRVDF